MLTVFSAIVPSPEVDLRWNFITQYAVQHSQMSPVVLPECHGDVPRGHGLGVPRVEEETMSCRHNVSGYQGHSYRRRINKTHTWRRLGIHHTESCQASPEPSMGIYFSRFKNDSFLRYLFFTGLTSVPPTILDVFFTPHLQPAINKFC